MKHFLLLSLSILLFYVADAQIIAGKVVQMSDSEPIPFATVAVSGSTLGVVCDFEGNFSLDVSKPQTYKTLAVTCVGYKELKLDLKTVLGNEKLILKLEAEGVDIDEVVVEEKSLLPYTVVKKAIVAIPQNYPDKAYNYTFAYTNTDKFNNAPDRTTGAQLKLYDSKGYHKENVLKDFESINYKTSSFKRNFAVSDLESGMIHADDLLENDLARHSCNILDISKIDNFDIVIVKEIQFEGEAVWQLHFETKSLGLLGTGTYDSKTFSGELYIKKSDYAVVYAKTELTANAFSGLTGNLSAVGNSLLENLKSYKKTAEVHYKKQGSRYIPSSITSVYEFFYIQNEKNQLTKRSSELKLSESKLTQPEVIKNRTYFEYSAQK